VVVITSPSGAAVRDILNVLARRNSGMRVTILPAAVQGEAAPAELIKQLELANRLRLGDVVIIGRGGGSLEDLLAFSDEGLVRAVAASELPVISAVGHEIDWALTDYAADLRAPTPSAAAELVSESRETLRATVAQLGAELETALRSRIDALRFILGRFEPSAIEGRFMRLFHPALRRFDEARDLLVGEFQRRISETRHRLSLASGLLSASSPEALLARGYAVVRRREDGAIVKNAGMIASGDLVDMRFARGAASGRIEEVKE
jgi:exodeoxyribonuclease VII large subunit